MSDGTLLAGIALLFIAVAITYWLLSVTGRGDDE